MSEPLRIAAAVEGPTDAIVLQAILSALLPDTEFVFQTLQPEESAGLWLRIIRHKGRWMGRSLSLESPSGLGGRRLGVRLFGTIQS